MQSAFVRVRANKRNGKALIQRRNFSGKGKMNILFNKSKVNNLSPLLAEKFGGLFHQRLGS